MGKEINVLGDQLKHAVGQLLHANCRPCPTAALRKLPGNHPGAQQKGSQAASQRGLIKQKHIAVRGIPMIVLALPKGKGGGGGELCAFSGLVAQEHLFCRSRAMSHVCA